MLSFVSKAGIVPNIVLQLEKAKGLQSTQQRHFQDQRLEGLFLGYNLKYKQA